MKLKYKLRIAIAKWSRLAVNISGQCQICKQQTDYVTKLMVSPTLLSPFSMDITGLDFNFITCEQNFSAESSVHYHTPLQT